MLDLNSEVAVTGTVEIGIGSLVLQICSSVIILQVELKAVSRVNNKAVIFDGFLVDNVLAAIHKVEFEVHLASFSLGSGSDLKAVLF